MAIKNLDGKQFGDLIVIGDTGKRTKGRQRIMLCRRISDGELLEFNATSLTTGKATGFSGSKASSEKMSEIRSKMPRDEVVGKIFGNLKIIEDIGYSELVRYVKVENIESHEIKIIQFNSLKTGKSLGIDRKKISPKRKKSNSNTGVKGVSYRKETGKYRAYIGNDRLGTFETLEEAIEVRNKAEKERFINL